VAGLAARIMPGIETLAIGGLVDSAGELDSSNKKHWIREQ
jgi:hypothetical protein